MRLVRGFSNLPLMSRISDRRLLQVKGDDLRSVMKGLTTNNFEHFVNEPNSAIQHTLFLNSKGRIITDAFVVKPLVLRAGQIVPSTEAVWIEAFAEHSDELVAHIKKHSFRKHILIDDISDSIDTLLVYVPAS